MIFLAWLFAMAVAFYGWRFALLYRVGRPPRPEGFDGVLYQVGRAAVAERRGAQPRATVVAMHGLFESPRYFTEFYDDPGVQLILLSSGDYHVPFVRASRASADWAVAPGFPVGTIEYDAAVLVQALEHLPVTDSIRVHGHSRGGAVTLEAASMRPDLFRGVDVVLEAPVLPRVRPCLRVPRILRVFVPFVLALWRYDPLSALNRSTYGRLDSARKRELIKALPLNARRLITAMRNLASLETWMEGRDPDIYRNLEHGKVLVADDDQVLESDSIRASARLAEGRLEVVEVQDCSHFILLDKPEAVPSLGNARRPRAPEAAGTEAST